MTTYQWDHEQHPPMSPENRQTLLDLRKMMSEVLSAYTEQNHPIILLGLLVFAQSELDRIQQESREEQAFPAQQAVEQLRQKTEDEKDAVQHFLGARGEMPEFEQRQHLRNIRNHIDEIINTITPLVEDDLEIAFSEDSKLSH